MMPTVLECSGNGLERHLRLLISADLPEFDGHFPDHPILPGIAQVDWALRFAESVFGPLGAFHTLKQLKFTAIVHPEEDVSLHLKWDPSLHRLHFTYATPTEAKSQGIALFHPSAGENGHPS